MFFECASMLYKAFVQQKPGASVPREYTGIAERVAQKVGWNMRFTPIDVPGRVAKVPENKKVMVGLSGGLDSVYLMYKLLEQGYDVTAVHIAGLNREYAKHEAQAAEAAARKAGAEFLKFGVSPPKQAFPDNPWKNQLILSIMLENGAKIGIYRYAVGSDWTTPLSEAVVGFTITDSVEVYRAYWAGVQQRFPQAELIFIPDNVKKYDRLAYLYDRGALEDISSCVAPHRFRQSLHEKNEAKYGIHLMPGRCGSCYKCAMEYILLAEAGRIEKDEAFYRHSWDTLATSKTAHRPDLFAKSLPFERRLKNLLEYGS